MATLRDSLLPALDLIRGIPYTLGLRLYTVSLVVRTWSGTRVGIGTKTDTISPIKLAAGSAQMTVRQLTQKEIIASGGVYSDQDLIVGPITPPYTGSASDDDQISLFDPPQSSTPTEIFFLVVGPGHPSPGTLFKKFSQDVSKPFRYMLIIRNTGATL